MAGDRHQFGLVVDVVRQEIQPGRLVADRFTDRLTDDFEYFGVDGDGLQTFRRMGWRQCRTTFLVPVEVEVELVYQPAQPQPSPRYLPRKTTNLSSESTTSAFPNNRCNLMWYPKCRFPTTSKSPPGLSARFACSNIRQAI